MNVCMTRLRWFQPRLYYVVVKFPKCVPEHFLHVEKCCVLIGFWLRINTFVYVVEHVILLEGHLAECCPVNIIPVQGMSV